MKKNKFVLLLSSLFALLLSACDFSFIFGQETVDTSDPKYSYTIMMYMCGSDLEYDPDPDEGNPNESGLMSKDIKEVLMLKDMPSSFKVIIETGGVTNHWALSSSFISGADSISTQNLQRWEVIPSISYSVVGVTYHNKLKLVETLSTNKMAYESSFESFLKWGLKNYKAQKTGVMFSGHGSGIAGCAFDDNYLTNNYPNSLDTGEIYRASMNALAVSDIEKFDWIGFDCCLMGCADIASMMSDCYNYMIASQELEGGYGWDHDIWMKKIVSNTSIDEPTLFNSICESFIAQEHSLYCDDQEPGSECLATLAGYDLSKMNTFVSSFNSLINSIGTNVAHYQKYKTAFLNSKLNQFGDGFYGLADFSAFLDSLSQVVSCDTSNVKQAIEDVVVTNCYCPDYSDSPCGLNIFFPKKNSVGEDARKYGLQVLKTDYLGNNKTKFTAWQNMCSRYW